MKFAAENSIPNTRIDPQRAMLNAPGVIPPPSKLHGRRALVTAGVQGIGLALSRHLLADGCDVFVHYHRSTAAARTLEFEWLAPGRRCAHASAELTGPSGCEEIVSAAVAFLGSSSHATHTTPEATRGIIAAAIPLGRSGTVDDVARAVVFLASKYNGFITGTTLDINGGI